jgi:hypothetical protein
MTKIKKDHPRRIDRIIDYFGERLPMLPSVPAVRVPVPVRVASAGRI